MAYDLATVMDGLATASGVARAFGYPVPQITPPCVVVGYPTQLSFDVTAHALGTTGKVEATHPVWYVVADVLDKAARDLLGPIISGAGSIKAVLDGASIGCDIVNTSDCQVEAISFGTTEYLAVRFDVEVVG